MTLQQLKYLIGIADAGLNITAAAERLYTSQPGISKQIRQLEDELGMQLFTRKGRSLASLTPAGEQVLRRARRIMLEAENIRTLARDLTGETEGTLRIATTHTQARYVLPPVIQSFRERYPNVGVNLHQGTSEQIAELVSADQVDFAIASGNRGQFSDLVLLPCYHWERVVMVPKDHELAGLGKELDLTMLARHPLVTYVFSLEGESSLKRAFEQADLQPNVVFTARDADVIKTYVRIGMGVGVIASMAYECDDAKDLISIDATGLFPRSTTWLGFRRDIVLRRYMRDFATTFASHLTSELIDRATELSAQNEVDALFDGLPLPIVGGCGHEVEYSV